MDRDIAKKLIDELERQKRISGLDKDLFFNLLASLEIGDSLERFYEVLPDREQLIENNGRIYSFSLRRLIRNRKANFSFKSPLFASFLSFFGGYSSSHLIENIRRDKDLMNLFEMCKEPFSLLGKFKEYDFDSYGKTYTLSRPVLVIPFTSNEEKVNEWERANTTYLEETSFFNIPFLRKVRREDYLYS